MPGPSRHLRRASIYMAVLGSAMIVTIIGLSAIAVVRVQRRAAEGTNDLTEARLLAQSAIEMALLWMDADAGWRSSYSNGAWATDLPLGEGLFSVEGIDPSDGNLNNDDSDPLVLTGIGQQGQARFKLQITLTAVIDGLTCLETAICAGADIDVGSGALLSSNQTVSTNTQIESAGTVNADVEAVGSIQGTGYNGATTSGIQARTLPNPATVFNYYLANGTHIPLSAIPVSGGMHKIKDVVLTATLNPFGPTNPQGIYVIDCQWNPIRIEFSRLEATIVLLDPDGSSRLQNGLHWEPAIAGYPALLVRGSIELRHRNQPLSESGRNVNFNPPGAPYLGFSDLDQTDTYPALIKGLVYVSGTLNVANYDAILEGALVVGAELVINGGDSLSVTYDPTILSNPPPGFAGPPEMVISPASWRQVVD